LRVCKRILNGKKDRSGEETVRRKAEVGKEKANASEGIKWPFLFLKQLLHLLTFSSKNCSAGGF